MFALIKRKLSLKVSLTLTAIIVPIIVIGAWTLASRERGRLERMTIAQAEVAARTAARAYGALLEAGIDAGAFTLADLTQPTYEEIKGAGDGHPRFHTKFDSYTDRVMKDLLDATLESSPDFLFAVGVDMNGYAPTHDSKYNQPPTGDKTHDLNSSRAKRKFTDPVVQHDTANLQPSLVQFYRRDTGQDAWNVSSPIFVRGAHFGAFRVAVSIESLDADVRALQLELLLGFSVLGVVVIGAIFFMLRRSMKPLVALSTLGDQISLGEGLDQEIKVETTDEVGQMARSMDRLRASLQVVMSRLGE